MEFLNFRISHISDLIYFKITQIKNQTVFVLT